MSGPTEEDLIYAAPIYWVGILEDGSVALGSEDAFDKPLVHTFDGKSTTFCGSIYESGDFWFADDDNSTVWYGIYTDPIKEVGYVKLSDDDE